MIANNKHLNNNALKKSSLQLCLQKPQIRNDG